MRKSFTVIEICPRLEGDVAAQVVQALGDAMRNVECEVSLRDLAAHLAAGEESYLVRVSINGQRLCAVRVVA